MFGTGRADGVTVADPVGARVEPGPHEPFEVVEVGSGAVLAEHLDPQPVVGGVLDEFDGGVDDRLAARVHLRLDVFVRGGHHEVDAVNVTIERAVDVGPNAARKTGDRGIEPLGSDAADSLAFALGGTRRAGLDHVNARGVELAGDVDLVRRGERDARHLFAVAQRRVQQLYLLEMGEVVQKDLRCRWVLVGGRRVPGVGVIVTIGEFHGQPP
ncbi:MAG: hypothetical protein A07HR67_02404 [uncultured archaeon A07HR67]|nr:MAG: hypothetical protein A07HR67_02404 [uncultured archaeon A07HR67]